MKVPLVSRSHRTGCGTLRFRAPVSQTTRTPGADGCKRSSVPNRNRGWQMKKFLLTSVALSALVAGPAMAADLAVRAPIYKAPPPVPVYFTWTGCYVGGHVGGLWARKDWEHRTPGFFGLSGGSHDADSWLGGVQAGCDYQFAGGWVI